MFISLDGIDGGGKSTQVARLCDRLRAAGHRVLSVRDPGGTPTGEAIRSLLLDSELSMNRRSEAMLFMAARAELVQRQIVPALADGQVVVSDRFLLANVVYQSIGSDSVVGLSPDDLWKVGLWATAGVRPDITLLLDLPADVAMRRIDRPADRMESRGLDYLQAVRQAFLDQLPRASDQTVIIDAGGAPDQVHDAILKSVFDRVA
jgi:dTMP kinase